MFKKFGQLIQWLYSDEPEKTADLMIHSDALLAPESFVFPRSREEIENDEIIQDKLRVLKRSGLALPFEVWPEFVVDTVVNYALWCQDLPASESYHHAGKRGLLLHSLDTAIYAMRLRRNYILPPNVAPEDVIHREIIWVYGVFLCALLHDAGKVLDMEVELYVEGAEPRRWTPALGPITQPYRCRYYKDRQYATHQHNGLLLLNQLLSANPMAAITHDRPLYHAMTEYLSGHSNPDNVISQIITQADAASVAQDLGADKDGINLAAEKARNAPLSLAGQLRVTLVHLIESGQIPLNKKGAEGFVDGESLFLMSKPIADRLRTALIERGITSVPSDNSRLFNELQQHQLIRDSEDGLAIWRCDVLLTEHDWKQTFTFVCVHWPSLVPEAALTSLVGTITPVVSEPEEEEDVVSSVSQSIESAASMGEEVSAETQRFAPDNEKQAAVPDESQVDQDLMQFFSVMSPDVVSTESEPVVEEIEPEEPVLEFQVSSEPQPLPHPVEEKPVITEPDNANIDGANASILSRQIDLREVKGEALGQAFYEWVDAVLTGGVHPVNKKGALFHRVEQGMLVVSPGAFRQFIQERCSYSKTSSYVEVQQGLQPLGLHTVTAQGRNVHKAQIKDASSTLNGFLFSTLPAWQERYAINPHVFLEDV